MLKKKVTALLAATLMLVSAVPAFAATPDSYESNDTMNTATRIYPMYYGIDASLDRSNDVDWYKVKANNTGYLTIEVQTSDQLSLSVDVYDYHGAEYSDFRAQYSDDASTPTDTVKVKLPVVDGLYYYIAIDSMNGSTGEYSIEYNKIQYDLDAAYEDNNTVSDEHEFDFYAGSALAATIKNSSDVDYYIFKADKTETVQMKMINPGSEDYNFFVQRVGGGVVADADNEGSASESETCNLIAGEYYRVIVYGDTSSDYFADIPYQLYLVR